MNQHPSASPWHALTLILFSVSLCLCGSTALRANLDPELKQPYRFQVVLHIARHPSLTDVFRDQVERELRDGLSAALGDLARVEVVRQHPRLPEVLEKGLQQGLDGWKELSDTKTHFVLIDFVRDQYEIQARQHDGLTGQPSAVVRRERVLDRRFVSRAAALLLDLDFGLVGTVTDRGDGQTVRVTLKGAGLGVPLERWVRKGEVFALVGITQNAGRPWPSLVRFALLQVEEAPKDGVCVCKLYHRYTDPLTLGSGVLGYRCIKLGTTQAPLRLRFVEEEAKTPTPRPNLQVNVRRHGFRGEDTTREQGTTNADGVFQTAPDKPYQHLAFITVLDGGTEKARIPVPIIDDRPMIIGISVKAEAGTPLLIRRNLWIQRLYENLLVQADLFKQLNELAAKPEQRALALERAQVGLKALQADVTSSVQELGSLRKGVEELGGAAKLDLTDGEQRIADLRKIGGQLQDFITGLEKVIKEENDPKRRELLAKIERARLLETEAEFGEAIALYQEVLKGGEFPELKVRVEKLNAAWELKDAKHRQARTFIYETWPKLDHRSLKDRLAQGHVALEACKDAGDTLSPQKLLKVAVGHVAKLNELEATLMPMVIADDIKTAELVAEVREGLGKLIQDVSMFLEQGAK